MNLFHCRGIMAAVSCIAINGKYFSTGALPRLRGVIFDMDGTLTVPNLDIKAMYERCNVPMSEDLLAAVSGMPPDRKAAANAVIDAMEEEGRRTLEIATGVTEMAKWLESHNIPCALVTRNTKQTVDVFFSNVWKPAGLRPFAVALSRDSTLGLPPKPNPASLFHIATQWEISLPTEELVMVGDSPSNDVRFGKDAGVATVLVDSGRRHLEEGLMTNQGGGGADICVESLALLPRQLWLRYHIDGPLGTSSPLLKYDVPIPSNMACIAAAQGDETSLFAMSIDDLNAADATGNTPLIWASDAGHLRCVERLLAVGVNVNVRGYLGNTACSRASRKGHIAVLRALCAAGADADIENIKMQFPLHFAAFKKHPDAVSVLLAHGANPLVLDRKGRTPSEDTSDDSIRDVLRSAMVAVFRNNTK